jgi:hypothetical protein
LIARGVAPTSQAASTARKQPGQAGKPWSPEEDRRLVEAFDQGADLDMLTASHARSKGGIASRLVRLGRIRERAEIRVRGKAEAPAAAP